MAYLPVLLRIQEIRNCLKNNQKSVDEIKHNSTLIALKTQVKQLNQDIALVEANQDSNQKTQQRLDLELKSFFEKLKQEEAKLYSGSIVNPRELEQIQQKVSEYNLSKTQLEEELIRLMEKAEELADLRRQKMETLKLCQQKIALLQKELEQKLFEFKLESEQLNSELEELLPQVPKDWSEKLERIAGSHNGIGISQIKAGSCGACHVSLSESLLQKAKRGEDQILLCENCGRIIFF